RLPTLPASHRRALRRLVAGADAITSVGRWLGETVHAAYPDAPAPRVIPNGMRALEALEASRADIEAAAGVTLPERFVVLVGNCRHIKGQDIAVEAWALLRDAGAPVPLLVVIGGGPELDALRERAAQLALSEHIVFTGYLPRGDAIRGASLAALQLAPSRSEGQGLVLLEAGYVATPVLASDIPAFLDLIDDGANGYLFESESPADLARRVGEIWAAPDAAAATGQALQTQVRRDFTIDAMVAAYEAVFAEVSGG
ncbi:MAG: glycosyltransferase family 4 protein, partial [Gammaproteobacteria bacterium]|nr:glycosyltransferase family 4 protein [Gammaproteobacteria bacterium]